MIQTILAHWSGTWHVMAGACIAASETGLLISIDEVYRNNLFTNLHRNASKLIGRNTMQQDNDQKCYYQNKK